MKLLFLTTHNLATNPRLYKELKLAVQEGYNVELVCFEFNNWSNTLNEELKKKLEGVKINAIPAGRKPFLPWFFSVAAETLWRFLGRIISLPLCYQAQAVSRRSSLIINELGNIAPPDWVIGHNPGALYATMVAGKRFNCYTGFDVEDYHPGEGNDRHLQRLSRRLMKSVLPTMNYVSFASPLIQEHVEVDTGVTDKNWVTVLNYFPIDDFVEPKEAANGPLRLVWFSQNINYERGLELLLPVVKSYPGMLQLHLFGNLDQTFFQNELENSDNVIIHPPLPQLELHRRLRDFDIGLALEPAKDRNNELAVSNKILAYLQSGLFVLATNTEAQHNLLKEFPTHGLCFDHKEDNSVEVIEKLLKGIDEIRGSRQSRFQSFQKRSWEPESMQLVSEWKKQQTFKNQI